MIPFRRPTLEDRAMLHPLFFRSPYQGCEYSFVNIYLWGTQQFALVEDEIVLFSHWDGRSMYVYPNANKLDKILPLLREDAAQRGIPLRLASVPEAAMAEIERLFPEEYGFALYRNGFDYLYDIDRLTGLRGKKLQQKRNHINRFEEQTEHWYTRPITEENIVECRQMVSQWYEEHAEMDIDYSLEKVAIRRAFDGFFSLGMEGLALYADGALVAMTMGNRLREDIFDVNFEKAYASIPGTYPLINREFARYLHEKYPAIRYLNREDDMGLPGLRKSKLSYHPDLLLEKYRGFLNSEETP